MKAKITPCCCQLCGNCTKAPTYRVVVAGEPCCCPACGHCVRRPVVQWYPWAPQPVYPPIYPLGRPVCYGENTYTVTSTSGGSEIHAYGVTQAQKPVAPVALAELLNGECRALN